MTTVSVPATTSETAPDSAKLAPPAEHVYVNAECTLADLKVKKGFNVRTVYDDIDKLALSIRSNGQETPITVGPKGKDGFYPILGGHRRHLAFTSMKWTGPIRIQIKTPKDDADALLENLGENGEVRKGLRSYDVAQRCAKLEAMGTKRKDIAARCGYDPKHIGLLVRCVNKLHPDILEAWGNPKAQLEIPLQKLAKWSQEEPEKQLEMYNEYMAVEEDDLSNEETGGEGGGEGTGGNDSPAKKAPGKRAISEQLATWQEQQKEQNSDELKRLIRCLRWVLGEVKKP